MLESSSTLHRAQLNCVQSSRAFSKSASEGGVPRRSRVAPRPPSTLANIPSVFLSMVLCLKVILRKPSVWCGDMSRADRLDNQPLGVDRLAIPCHDTARGLVHSWLTGKAASLVNDLNLDINLIGRKAHAIGAEVLRELNQSDLALLATERGIQPTHVQRITDRHHALARCLATGMSATEAGLVTGYTASRISVLRGDPSFEELIAFYRQPKEVKVRDLAEKLTDVASEAAGILLERMDTEPEKIDNGVLLDSIKLGADRTGFGPKQTSVNLNVNLGDRMKAARERVALAPPPTVSSHPAHASAGGIPSGPVVDVDFTEVGK